MTIGIVLPQLPGYSEIFLNSLIKGLGDNGYSLILFVNQPSRQSYLGNKVKVSYLKEGSTVIRFLRGLVTLIYLLVRCPGRIYKFIALERSDFIPMYRIIQNMFINAHIFPYRMDWLYCAFATQAIRRENLAKAIGARFAVSLRGFDINLSPLHHRDMYKYLWGKIDALHYLSDSLFHSAVELGCPMSIKKFKIPPAIDIDFFSHKYNWSDHKDSIEIITVARLHWVKGLTYAIEAMKKLKDSGANLHYTIVGEGQDRERLCYLIHHLGLKENIKLVGKKSPEEIRDLLNQNDIYIAPSVSEGFGNSVVEAQAAGLACISSNSGGLVENIVNNHNGFIVKSRSPKEIADSLMMVYKLDKNLKNNIVENARNEVELKNNLILYIDKWKDMFNE